MVVDEIMEQRQDLVNCSNNLVENVIIFVKHVNTEIELCLG